jgi:Domain of unknown function (DUF4440)
VDHALQDGAHQLSFSFRQSGALALAGALACAGLVPSCSRTPKDPVQALLAELEEAAEDRDAERFAERLAPSFQAAGAMGRPEAVATLKRYFAGYESVNLTVYGTEVERAGAAARVRTIVEFSGRARKLAGLEGLLPPEAVYRFDLRMAEEGGEWKVQSAKWNAVEPGERP